MTGDPWQKQKEALGGFIRAQRNLASLSLRQLSEMTDVSNAYLSQIERGLHEPSIRVLRSVAEALGIAPETLLEQAGRETDFEARKALYGQFQDIVGEELPVYWINALPYHNVFDDRIGNPPLTIWGMMQAMDQVYWTEDR